MCSEFSNYNEYSIRYLFLFIQLQFKIHLIVSKLIVKTLQIQIDLSFTFEISQLLSLSQYDYTLIQYVWMYLPRSPFYSKNQINKQYYQ